MRNRRLQQHRRAAAGRGDEHDPAAGGTDLGEQSLGDGDLAKEVDLELAAKVWDGDSLDRAQHSDAGVVHQRVQPGGHLAGQGGDVRLVGDVEQDRCHTAVLGGEAIPAGVVADAGQDGPPGGGQSQRDGFADAAASSGDEYRRHGVRPFRRETSAYP